MRARYAHITAASNEFLALMRTEIIGEIDSTFAVLPIPASTRLERIDNTGDSELIEGGLDDSRA